MPNKSTGTWLLIIAFILWMFFVLGSFFAVQKPFSGANALAIGRVGLDLLVAGWLTGVALLVGSWLLQQLTPNDLTFGETLIFGTGLGLGTLGLLVFGIGLAGFLQPGVAYTLTLLLTLLSLPQLLRLQTAYRHWQRNTILQPPHPLIVAYLLFITLLTLLLALLPPTDWDGLFYHLTGPKLYIQAGQISSPINIPHLSFPSLLEMLYTWAMLLRGDIVAKLLHTVFAFLLAGLVYQIAHRFFGQKSAWPALLIFTSMPLISTLAGWAYNDLALAFYQLAAVYAFVRWRWGDGEMGRLDKETNDQGPMTNDQRQLSFVNCHLSFVLHPWLILSGIFAGLAMGLKYTSFVTPLLIGLLLLRTAIRNSQFAIRNSQFAIRNSQSAIRNPQSPREASNLPLLISPFLTFSLTALLVAAPWYLKNWVFTGNPVYPFLYGLFGGQYWDEFRAAWYASAGSGIGFQPGTLLALPWLLTLGLRDANYWDGRSGPLLLLFLPVILFYALFQRHRIFPTEKQTALGQSVALNTLLLYVLAHFAFWTLGVMWSRSLWQSRLLLPGLVSLTPLAGWAWAELSTLSLPNFSLGRFVNIAIGLTLLLTTIDVGLLTLQINPVPYLVGLETRDEYLTRRLGAHYAAMQEINERLPAEAKVVFLWEPRSYYCQVDCRPDSILDEFPHLVEQYGSAEAIAQAWQAAGVTYVLVHRSGLNLVLQEAPEKIDQAVLSDLEARYWQEEFDIIGAYQLYRLRF